MRRLLLAVLFCSSFVSVFAQKTGQTTVSQFDPENIYSIKQQFLYQVLHNPTEKEGDGDDNELTRFNRWFHDVEPRCYPSGILPRPDVLLTAMDDARRTGAKKIANKSTVIAPVWQSLAPTKVPANHNGIGRINCIVIDPNDTNTLYVGAACGGVHISHDGGATWTSNSDNFPSLSIADIAVNPHNSDTLYAATGDGYGYEGGTFGIFWGGLYSAGVMKSTDGGNTWHTTGLSYLQSDRDIIQKLLIHPNNTNILLAATRHGIQRSVDAGATWTVVDAGHVFSMAFRPQRPDTVYAINNSDLRVSYDAGATWQTLSAGLNPTGNRCTIGVSPAAPGAVWLLDSQNKMKWSHNSGYTFYSTNPPDTANFYGYYDRVFAVSPVDSDYLLAYGMIMAVSLNGGLTWGRLDPPSSVHVDFHAVAINPLHPSTIYSGDDGGISVTRNGGASWKNLANGLMISQIYRMSSSQQNPGILICGLQDNGTFTNDGSAWLHKTGGDGEACAIHPVNDMLQISSSQNGYFNISYDQGLNFTHINVTSEAGAWTAPVVFDPNNQLNMYFGYQNIYASHDQGSTFFNLTSNTPFAEGAMFMAIGQSNSHVIYVSDMVKMLRTTDGGSTWTNVTGNLPVTVVAISHIAVDPRNPMVVYATTSGYQAGTKVFISTTGGTTWTNISGNLPNLPADCIAIDTSTPGALFAGTDIGVYYTDSSQTGWTQYGTGLPNVIANDLDVNYGNYKLRVATYGRGVWECNLPKSVSSSVTQVKPSSGPAVQVYPNPTRDGWRLIFQKQKPKNYSLKISDINGRTVQKLENTEIIDAAQMPAGVYNIEVVIGNENYNLKAVKE